VRSINLPSDQWREKIMEKKKDNPEKKDVPLIDFGLNFGGLLQELGNFTQDLTRMVEEGKDEMEKIGEISLNKSQKLKGMYGISFKIGGNGIPKVDTFGRRPKDDTREPIVDIFDEEKRLQVVVELPGVEENDITVVLNGNTINIDAGKGDRRYHKVIDLDIPVKDQLKSQYKNGILEINLEKE
jgi:HSP20 family protein